MCGSTLSPTQANAELSDCAGQLGNREQSAPPKKISGASETYWKIGKRPFLIYAIGNVGDFLERYASARAENNSARFVLAFPDFMCAKAKIADQKPDIVVLDATSNPTNALSFCVQTSQSQPSIRMIALFRETHRGAGVSAAGRSCWKRIVAGTRGACSCILIDEFEANASELLFSAQAGFVTISESLLKSYVMHSSSPGSRSLSDSEGLERLTSREIEVLQISAKGLSQKEVASVLKLSPHTISGYFKCIYAKLEVNTRSEALFEARRLGYLR